MNKRIIIVTLLGLNLLQTVSVFAQGENLSPIETIEWVTPKTDQEQEDASVNNNEEIQESNETEEISQEGQVESDSELFSQIKDIWQAIQESQTHLASDYYAVSIQGETIVVDAQGLLSKEGNCEFTTQKAPLLPETYFIQVEDDKLMRQWVSLDSLINYVADAINTFPEQYAGSPIEDFYIYAQEHMGELEGKYVEVDLQETEDNYSSYVQINNFFKEVIDIYINEYKDAIQQDAKEIDGGLIEMTLTPDINKIIQDVKTNYPESAEIEQLTAAEVEGNLVINRDNNEISLSLLNEISQGEHYGIEFYIQVPQQDPMSPGEDEIMTQEELTRMVGFDVVKSIQEFNASLNLEEMQVSEESNE